MRRSLAASTVVCLSLLGAGAIITADSRSAAAEPSNVPGVIDTIHYHVGTEAQARDWIVGHLNEGFGTHATRWYLGFPERIIPVVLVGDAVTWHEAVGMVEDDAAAVFGPNASHWSIDPDGTTFADYGRINMTIPPDNTRPTCATDPPVRAEAGSRTLFNAWCMGPLTYTVTIENVRAADNNQSWAASAYDSTGELAGLSPHGIWIAGPGNDNPGHNTSSKERLYVLDPSLLLTKKVCTTTVVDDCDINDPNVWRDEQEIPAGSSQAVFRVEVENTGNVELANVHMAQDTTKAEAGERAVIMPPTTQAGIPVDGAVFADSLMPGAKAAMMVIVPIDGTLDGELKNLATANAELPGVVSFPNGSTETQVATVDPAKKPLSDRFTGNPTVDDPDGEPGMVPSNEDAAKVFERVKAIDLEKYVCDGVSDCDVPTGGDLADLASGKNAGGWVKMTTVPMAADAQWLLVVTNTGNTTLGNVTLKREDLLAGGDGHDGQLVGCAMGDDLKLGQLASGESKTVTCTTGLITNTEEWGSKEDVVNTAKVCAEVEDDTTIMNGSEVCSKESSAEVNTVEEPAPPPDEPTPSPTPSPTTPQPAPKPPAPPRLLGGTGANAALAVVLGVILLAGGAGLVTVRMRARQAR